MVLKMARLNPVFQRKNWFRIIFTESWDFDKNVSGLFRYICYKQQNQTAKNEYEAQKNVNIFKSNAPTLLKLGVGLDHMHTKD